MTTNKNSLRLEGVLTIKNVADTHSRLTTAFAKARASKSALEIEVADDCDCDLTLGQLLLATQKSAETEGLELRIRAAQTSAFVATLKRAGLAGSDQGRSTLLINGDHQ